MHHDVRGHIIDGSLRSILVGGGLHSAPKESQALLFVHSMFSLHSRALLAFTILSFGEAWLVGNPSYKRRVGTSFFATVSNDVDTYVLEGDEKSIQQAAAFMFDAFWIGDTRVQQGSGSLSEGTKSNLVNEQAQDFTAKYGERMGKRLLESCLVVAADADSRETLGLVSLEVSLLDRNQQDIMPNDAAESLLKNTVASLGPKQRREYKDSTAVEIANDLLPTEQEAVCCLSNLAISPSARRRGIAMKLCADAEELAKGEDFDMMYLKVEKDNEPALRLYQDKLGYEQVFLQERAPAMRLDLDQGTFEESRADTLILAKKL